MNALKPTFLPIKPTSRRGFVPEIRTDATIEELDEWIIALGGREISPEEAQQWQNKILWAPVPGETVPI